MTGPASDRGGNSVTLRSTEGMDGLDEGELHLKRIGEMALSALKIITVAVVVGGEETEDFFSEHGNYLSILGRLKNEGLVDSSFPESPEDFSKSPTDCWMMVIAVLFGTLYSLPGHFGVWCDVISSSNPDARQGEKVFSGEGSCFSITLKLEMYDWSHHRVDFFVPSNESSATLFIVDDSPALFSILRTTSEHHKYLNGGSDGRK